MAVIRLAMLDSERYKALADIGTFRLDTLYTLKDSPNIFFEGELMTSAAEVVDELPTTRVGYNKIYVDKTTGDFNIIGLFDKEYTTILEGVIQEINEDNPQTNPASAAAVKKSIKKAIDEYVYDYIFQSKDNTLKIEKAETKSDPRKAYTVSYSLIPSKTARNAIKVNSDGVYAEDSLDKMTKKTSGSNEILVISDQLETLADGKKVYDSKSSGYKIIGSWPSDLKNKIPNVELLSERLNLKIDKASIIKSKTELTSNLTSQEKVISANALTDVISLTTSSYPNVLISFAEKTKYSTLPTAVKGQYTVAIDDQDIYYDPGNPSKSRIKITDVVEYTGDMPKYENGKIVIDKTKKNTYFTKGNDSPILIGSEMDADTSTLGDDFDIKRITHHGKAIAPMTTTDAIYTESGELLTQVVQGMSRGAMHSANVTATTESQGVFNIPLPRADFFSDTANYMEVRVGSVFIDPSRYTVDKTLKTITITDDKYRLAKGRDITFVFYYNIPLEGTHFQNQILQPENNSTLEVNRVYKAPDTVTSLTLPTEGFDPAIVNMITIYNNGTLSVTNGQETESVTSGSIVTFEYHPLLEKWIMREAK